MIRLAQLYTGGVGSEIVRRLHGHPELELVAVLVHSEAKAGIDSGTLVGTEPNGVVTTQSLEQTCWEQDYPHSDSEWPRGPEVFLRHCESYGVSDEDINAITHENAMRLYHFDPFHIRPRESCTVGALRREAEGHDVSTRRYDQGRHRRSPITISQLEPTG